MVEYYRSLFYNFNTSNNHCTLCSIDTDVPIEYHLLISCPHLKRYRHNYWNLARINLSKPAQQINTIHHQLFMQHIMETTHNINTHPNELWQIISGVNTYSNNNHQFKFSYIPISINESKDTFFNHLTSYIHQYIFNIFNLNKSARPDTRRLENKCNHNIALQQNVYYHMRCDNYIEWYNNHQMLNNNDIIAATDSSYKNGKTGIGIYIKNKNKIYKFSQGLGSIDNHYGELFAIRKALQILKDTNIANPNQRLFIMTDSLNNFLPLITTPKNPQKKIKDYKLWKETQSQIQNMNAILIKIKSHTKPTQQYFNEQADILADQGRTNPNNDYNIIPSIHSLYASHLEFHINPRSYSQIINDQLLKHPNPFNIPGLLNVTYFQNILSKQMDFFF